MSRPLDRLRTFASAHPLRFRAGVGLLVLVLSVIGLLAQRSTPPARAGVVDARLELAAGEVKLREGERSTTVISGVPLPAGAELATGKGARALVRLADGSSLFLRGDSTVRLAPEGAELASGELWLDAPPSERAGLLHKAGEVTISATDAGLSLRNANGEVLVVVTRGLAVVTSPKGRVEVNAGEQAEVKAGAAPKVGPVLFWDDWTGGMGDSKPLAGAGSGAGRIYGVEPQRMGAKARTLEINRQAVRAVIRDGLAETEVDQTFGNPGGDRLEGWYWFSVPERAIVTSFAVETNGVLVEGEVIERKEAAARYTAAVASGNAPALLEWIDGRTYRSRIYPIPATGRRVVLRYLEVLPFNGGKLEYLYPMRSDEPARIGEFSLEVDLGEKGMEMRIASLADAVVEQGGRRVTMRRSGYLPRADFQIEATPIQQDKRAPLTVSRFSAGTDRADYVMARYVPDIDWATLSEPPGDVAVVVDTSASGDEAVRQQKAAGAEAILRALSQKDHFVLIAIDSAPVVLWPKEGLAEATDKEIAAALARLSEHAAGGATDLGALFDAALGRLHGAEQPAVVYIGDGLPTSGEVSADRLAERMRRSLSTSRARLFTVAVGTTPNVGLLRELARQGGGQSFRIDRMETATSEVLRLASAIKTPTVTDLSIDLGAGLDEAMITASGKVSRGEEVLLLARTHHALPEKATVKGRVGGKDFTREHPIVMAAGVGSSLVPRLWAAEKIRRLLGEATDPEEQRGKIVEIGLEYGLMTPFTSILALENENAYRDQGLERRRSPLRGVRLTELDARTERTLLESLAPAAPRVAFGCTKGDSEPPMRSREEAPATVAAPAPPPAQAEQQIQQNQPQYLKVPEPEAAERTVTGSAATTPPTDQPNAGNGADGFFDGKPGVGSRGPAPVDESAAGAKKAEPMPRSAGGGGAPAKPKLAPGPSGDKRAAPPHAEPVVPVKIARTPPALLSAPCSDVARRPLADRIVVWSKRLRGELDGQTIIERYEAAKGACEIPDWRAEQALLDLLQQKARTEESVSALLGYLASAPDTQRHVAQAILRRTVEPRIDAAVRRILFGEKVRWVEVDAELAELDKPEDKLAKLRERLLVAPGDPEGELRMVRLLAQAGQRDDALAYGRRLRDRGFMSPALALALGDVLAAQGFADEALRTYSEIVEFDPQSADSRRLLGDVFLRHGWYPAAYRQYKTLTDLTPQDAPSFLRLAMAAAGSGRVDEALRVQRQVASAEGTPGPRDPRLWARLGSAAYLAKLRSGEGKPVEPALAESLDRKLKELSLWSGPSAIAILAWEDLGVSLALVGKEGDRDAALGELSESAAVGLSAVEIPLADEGRIAWTARLRSALPGREVRLALHVIAWDGKAFRVKTTSAKLGPADKEVALP